MADDQQSKTGMGAYTWLWMILALVTVAGFLTWLGMTAEPTSVTVVEEEDETAMDPPSVPVVHKDTLGENEGRFVARDIRVHNVTTTGTLGDVIHWGELGTRTTQVPILLRLDSAAAAGFEPESGTAYSVRGRVFPMTDSLANRWGEQGDFFGEGEQTQAAFTDFYMQVSDIRPTPASLRPGSDTAADTAADTAGTAGDTTEGMSGEGSGMEPAGTDTAGAAAGGSG